MREQAKSTKPAGHKKAKPRKAQKFISVNIRPHCKVRAQRVNVARAVGRPGCVSVSARTLANVSPTKFGV